MRSANHINVHFWTYLNFLFFPPPLSTEDSPLQQSPPSKKLEASTLCLLLGNHAGICSPSLHTPLYPSVLSPPSFLGTYSLATLRLAGVQTAIHCQDLPASSIHVPQLFHCSFYNPRTVACYAHCPGIDTTDQIPSIQFGFTQLFDSSVILRCYLTFHLTVESLVHL